MNKLPNLGPRSSEMLAQAGIENEHQLRQLGSVAAYLAVKRAGGNPSLNLLWALEGALTNRHWTQVAQQDRLHLLMQLEDKEKESP